MSLQNIDLPTEGVPIPEDVRQVVMASHAAASQYMEAHCSKGSGFVPSDPELVYSALRAVGDLHTVGEISFCEWGSGFGTATCLAAKLGFDACGIEVEPQLVKESRRLAEHFQLSAVFAEGSFVPARVRPLSEEAFSDNEGRYPWLRCQASDAYERLGREPDSFDVVFAYPWPGEEYYMSQLFQELAGPGSLFLSYSDKGEMNLLRKLC